MKTILMTLLLTGCLSDTPVTAEKYSCTGTLVCDDKTFGVSADICGDGVADFKAYMEAWLVRTHSIDGCHEWSVVDERCKLDGQLCTPTD